MFRLYIKTKLDPQAEAIKHRLGPEIIFDNSLVNFISYLHQNTTEQESYENKATFVVNFFNT